MTVTSERAQARSSAHKYRLSNLGRQPKRLWHLEILRMKVAITVAPAAFETLIESFEVDELLVPHDRVPTRGLTAANEAMPRLPGL